MDNSKDLFKVLDGLKGAINILKNGITKEVLEQMTPKQREDYNKAINNNDIIKSVADLEKFTKTI